MKRILPSSLLLVTAFGCSTAEDDHGIAGALSRDGRLHVQNAPLSLNSQRTGLGTRDFKGEGFVYVAGVDAPRNPKTGTVVQATNFAFAGSYAFVVYNTAGEEVGGALEIVDLREVERPVLAGSIAFTRSEFADVRVIGPYAILTGQQIEGDVTGANLTVIDISDVGAPTFVSSLALPGRYATSLAVDGNTAWITTGDDGGLVTVDIKTPAAPSIAKYTALPHALNVVRHYQQTFVLGGSPASVFAVADDQSLRTFSAPLAAGALAAPSRMAIWNNAIYTNAGSEVFRRIPLAESESTSTLATVDGTSNGIDVTSQVAVLAQGERGAAVYDVSNTASITPLGTFSFPDERGSSNQIRFGNVNDTGYIFLSHGLSGFRIVKTAFAVGDDPSACTAPWWTANDAATWWSAPAASGASTIGTWITAAESTDQCLVEVFRPSLSNSDCDALSLRRVRAIGPQPNEGQRCELQCPAGTAIANAHTRYGEASPLNASGAFSCTGTTTPALYEISCDAMTDSCNAGSKTSCDVRYHNETCGDPWYNCIKNGRTKWQCLPTP